MLRLFLFGCLLHIVRADCGNFHDDSEDEVCYEVASADNWSSARDMCHSLGAEVASVHNQQENTFIRRLAVSSGTVGSVYLGGAVFGKGDQFGWIDGTAWDYDNFRTGYPAHGQGDCLAMDTSTTAGQWINTACDTKMLVACARAPSAAPTTASTGPQPIGQDDPRYDAFKEASDILGSWMNTSADPCNDFYAFTCGAGRPDHPMSFDVADKANSESILSKLRQPVASFDPLSVRQMKWFYDACLTGATDAQYADRSRRIFNDLRRANPGMGFPSLYPSETNAATPVQLAQFLGYSFAKIGIANLLLPKVDTNWMDPQMTRPENKEVYMLFIDQPTPLYMPGFYNGRYAEFQDDVVYGILDTINAGAQLLGINYVDQKQALQDAKDMAQFDYDLGTKYYTDAVTRRAKGDEYMYNPVYTTYEDAAAPFLDWKTFLDQALAPISKTVDESDFFVIMESDNLRALSADITSHKITSRTLNNYVFLWALEANFLPYTGAQLKRISHLGQFRSEKRSTHRHGKVANIRNSASPIELTTMEEAYCQQYASYELTYASARVFVDVNYPSKQDQQGVIEAASSFIRSIESAFITQINDLKWMTAETKSQAYNKLKSMQLNVGFPDWILDDHSLSDYYKELQTSSSDSYLDQLDKILAFKMYEYLSPLSVQYHRADRTDFGEPVDITKVWYQPHLNALTVTAGMLRAPFYDHDYPAAFNYGALGHIAGHVLTTGFDDNGAHWDFDGRMNTWEDSASTNGFADMAACVNGEYAKFCPFGNGKPCVDAEQTQVENVADNGGVQAAYRAFKQFEADNGADPLLPGAASAFNGDQLFFLAFAQVWCQYPPSTLDLLMQMIIDTHSPSLYRVLGTLQNMPAFQKAFNCPIGSTYAPAQHCDVWV